MMMTGQRRECCSFRYAPCFRKEIIWNIVGLLKGFNEMVLWTLPFKVPNGRRRLSVGVSGLSNIKCCVDI